MKKKLLSLALALVLCMGLTTPALAAFDPGIAAKPTVLSLGNCTIAVIDENDTLWMWGSPYYGMLGNNGVTDDHQKIYAQETRIKVMENVRSVAISGSMVFPFAAAVKTDGSLWTWGSNMTGQLGNGGVGEIYEEWTSKPSVYKAVPVKIMDDVVAVSCGEGYAAAIKTDGSLWTWGDNKWGQLGDGTLEERKTPVKVMDQVSIVTCGMTNTAAVKEDGSLWMWGNTTGNALNNGGKGNTIGLQGNRGIAKLLV